MEVVGRGRGKHKRYNREDSIYGKLDELIMILT